MGRSKHTDIVCVVALIVALLVTGLIYRQYLTRSTVTEESGSSSEQFTEDDLNGNWSTDAATVITLNGNTGTVVGNGAYIYDGNVYIVYAGSYVISGELTDGSVIVDADGDDDIRIMLNGVSLSNSNTAAFMVEKADNVYLTLADQTENTITMGEEISESAEEDGVNGALFSRDDLTINGSGSLTVIGSYQHGIVAKDDFAITGGTVTVEAAEDGIHANDSVRIADASIEIDAGDDGVTISNDEATDYFYMESGSLLIENCYEGIEAKEIFVEGGNIVVYSDDDGLNATGSDGEGIVINDGNITVINTTGQDSDGFDSNASITINGGMILISVPSGGSNALDYGSENGGECLINGGTVIATGSSMMMEEISENSEQGFIVTSEISGNEGSVVSLTDGDGNILMAEEMIQSFSAITISTPEMETATTYTLMVDEESIEVTAGENSASSMGMGGGMGNGGRMGSGDGGRYRQDEASSDLELPSGDEMPSDDEVSEMSSDGEMPEMPSDGEMPEMPSDGEMPEMPSDGEMPEMPSDGEMPEMPSDGEMPEMPSDGEMQGDGSRGDASDSGSTVSGNGFGGGGGRQQMGQGGQMSPQNEENTEEVSSNVGTLTFVLIGISFLVLLGGLLFAWRFNGKM